MTTATPRVTVLIACFNVAPYLAETLESVRAQDFADFEVVMVDDGSTDGTAQIMGRYAAEDARFKTILLPNNQGVVAARNSALAIARGSYVAPLDGDDVWAPEALSYRVRLAEQYPSADVIATEFSWFESSLPAPPYVGRVSLGQRARLAFARSYESGDAMLLPDPFELVATLHFAWTGAMLIRREAMSAAGDFDTAFTGPEDTLLWLKLALRGPFVFSPVITAFYRQRLGSLVTTFKGPKELHYLKVLGAISELRPGFQKMRVISKLSAECHLISSRYLRSARNFSAALPHAIRAAKLSGGDMASLKNLVACLLHR